MALGFHHSSTFHRAQWDPGPVCPPRGDDVFVPGSVPLSQQWAGDLALGSGTKSFQDTPPSLENISTLRLGSAGLILLPSGGVLPPVAISGKHGETSSFRRPIAMPCVGRNVSGRAQHSPAPATPQGFDVPNFGEGELASLLRRYPVGAQATTGTVLHYGSGHPAPSSRGSIFRSETLPSTAALPPGNPGLPTF